MIPRDVPCRVPFIPSKEHAMNRRTFLQAAPALAGTRWIDGLAAHNIAATPAASPTPAPPPSYDEVAGLYAERAGHLLDIGQTAVDQLLGGDDPSLFARFAPQLRAGVSEDHLATLVQQLTVDRVTFEAPAYHLVFDGALAGDTLTGTLQSGGITPFTLQRSPGTPAASPVAASSPLPAVLAGRWQGTTSLPDGTDLALDLTFSDDAASGTLSIPEQQVIDTPLGGIVFDAERPVGPRTAENAIPHSPDLQIYWARSDWGGRGLGIHVSFDAAEAISGLQILPDWSLPPDPATSVPPLAPLDLPFSGLWWTYWGGDTVLENYHASNQQQRHAIDLMIWNAGATYHDDPSHNENYWVWGQPVLAPAGGTVVDVVDGIEANTPGALPANPADAAGNHIVLQIGDAAWLFLAHLQAGSIQVAQGDTIDSGTIVGLAGNSGNSSEPHLHIHAQSEPALFSPTAVGLPLVFGDVRVNGDDRGAASPRQGEFVSHS